MQRSAIFEKLIATDVFDLAIIGGGATGLGVALDAASRGYKVVLLEAHDFAKGTSSRATKLVHGGVRYLAQGNLSLVKEALHERAVLLHNAPHLAQPLAFVMPSYKWWETAFYGLGLMLYDLLAGKSAIGSTQFLSKEQVLERLPQVQSKGLRGGVQYWDGQFDDARLALEIARTAQNNGAVVLNYCPVESFIHKDHKLTGLTCKDNESGRTFDLKAKCVINATGVWVDGIRSMDAKSSGEKIETLVTPSQGVHLVVDRSFLGQDYALLVPSTQDGRVLFAVPWLGKVILGTTDTPRTDLPIEPMAFTQEVDFILHETARYFSKAATRADVRSVWVGLRPLVKPQNKPSANTKGISREHTILISESGLVTVTGGKWTTYRAMAEDVLQQCQVAGLISAAYKSSTTADCPLVGASNPASVFSALSLAHAQGRHSYGSEQKRLLTMPGADTWLCEGLSEAMVRFAVRYEYARTVEDVLARRSRLLFLDAQLACDLSDKVATILISEQIHNPQLAAFKTLAQSYLLPTSH
ncbi:MAG: glycerol-3-phosphate dehydrogenase/oxidase [Burkholderiales bacterium]|nr:glycerol-3-phosphate dehydrogenase/oxidase [Burkholderiales bacterium]